MKPTYTYEATILNVVDGDTVDILIDLGFTVTVKQRVRLQGLNAPEKNTPAGMASALWLREKLPHGVQVTVKSNKPGGGDKYGRYLAVIYTSDDVSLNDVLIASGHALPWDGHGKRPV